MRRSIIAILLPIGMAGGAAAQTVSDDPAAVAAAARRAIVERYVLPDVAAKLGTALASLDRYRGLTGQALAERIAAFYGAAAKGVKPAHPVANYAGVCGDRKLVVRGDRLTTTRGWRPASALVPVEPNVTATEDDPLSRFRFVEQGGRIVALEVERIDGSVERAERSAGL